MAGQMVHLEIPAGNTAKAKEFWGGLFGWRFQSFEGSPTEYLMTQFSDAQGGAIMEADGDKRGPRVYFDVDDINAGAARVGELGGEVGDPMPVPTWGGSRLCTDLEGNDFGHLADRRERLDVALARRRTGSHAGFPSGAARGAVERRQPNRKGRHAGLPAPRRPTAQATHRVPGQRDPAHRGGDGARGVLRERVDPLPPRLALSREGARRVHADRARGVDPRDPRTPAPEHVRGAPGGRRDHRSAHAHVEPGRRDLVLPARLDDGLLLPERRRATR